MVRPVSLLHIQLLTGTEKQHVAYDYALRLAGGNAECKTIIDEALSTLVSGQSESILAISGYYDLNQSMQ